MTAKRSDIMMDIRGFGMPEEIAIAFNHNVIPGNNLLRQSDLDASGSEPWEMCIFNRIFQNGAS